VSKVVPENDSPYARIVDLQLQLKQYAEAERTLQSALAINDTSPFLHAKLGLVNFWERDFNDAARHFQRAVEVNQGGHLLPASDFSKAYYHLALSEIQLGVVQSAKLNLVEVLRYQPQHAEAGRLLALLKKGVPVQLQF